MLRGKAQDGGIVRGLFENADDQLLNLLGMLGFLAKIRLLEKDDQTQIRINLRCVGFDGLAIGLKRRDQLVLRFMPLSDEIGKFGRRRLISLQVIEVPQTHAQFVALRILGEHLLDDETSAAAALRRRRRLGVGENHPEVSALVQVLAREFQKAAEILGGAVELAVLFRLMGLPEQRVGDVARLQPMDAEHGPGAESQGDDKEDEKASIGFAHECIPQHG